MRAYDKGLAFDPRRQVRKALGRLGSAGGNRLPLVAAQGAASAARLAVARHALALSR
jgi:hypothetical protein